MQNKADYFANLPSGGSAQFSGLGQKCSRLNQSHMSISFSILTETLYIMQHYQFPYVRLFDFIYGSLKDELQLSYIPNLIFSLVLILFVLG